jgi:SPP1 family predicted phage head-tail adaptor
MGGVVMPRVGELNHQVELQRSSRVADGMGGFTTTFVTIATVWAKMTTLRSDEAIQAMATTGTAIHNITIRYRTDVKAAWRVRYGSRYFAIIGPPIDVNFKHEFLELKCKETA